MSKLDEIFCTCLTVAAARSSSDDNAICYVLPDLWMTSCLPVFGQAKATPIARILKVTYQCNRGLKSDVYDCLVEISETRVQFCFKSNGHYSIHRSQTELNHTSVIHVGLFTHNANFSPSFRAINALSFYSAPQCSHCKRCIY